MCLSCRSGDCISQFDIFGAHVGVTYGGNDTYKTKLGGCSTLLLLLIFGSNMILSVVNVIISDTYSHKSTTKFTQYYEQTEPWSMSTQRQTLAGNIVPSFNYTMDEGMSPE